MDCHGSIVVSIYTAREARTGFQIILGGCDAPSEAGARTRFTK
jgi:hypothetical protein